MVPYDPQYGAIVPSNNPNQNQYSRYSRYSLGFWMKNLWDISEERSYSHPLKVSTTANSIINRIIYISEVLKLVTKSPFGDDPMTFFVKDFDVQRPGIIFSSEFETFFRLTNTRLAITVPLDLLIQPRYNTIK